MTYQLGELTCAEESELQGHMAICKTCVDLVLDLPNFSEERPPMPVAELKAAWRDLLAVKRETPTAFSRPVTTTTATERAKPSCSKIDRVVNEIMTHLRGALKERLSNCARLGHDPEEIGPAASLAQRMLAAVPEPSGWNDLLGPFYNTRQVARMLGDIPRQTVLSRSRRRTLLGLKTTDGILAYPAFQFDEHNNVLVGLPAVLQCFVDVDVDGWTLAGWLTSSQKALHGYSAIQWLQLNMELEPVVALARDMARRFSQ